MPSKYNFDDDEPMDIPPTEELDGYLKNRPLNFNRSAHALDWWHTNAQRYLNVARFAWDVLAIAVVDMIQCHCAARVSNLRLSGN
ncbi:unnamed protein product [Somion occarium]|uniref:HAT C-terminal dimerisation domain-containing protein n=1 Tax=Somion occarium TaxID=3059160 RepID=A0ABP1CN30_9APHY